MNRHTPLRPGIMCLQLLLSQLSEEVSDLHLHSLMWLNENRSLQKILCQSLHIRVEPVISKPTRLE